MIVMFVHSQKSFSVLWSLVCGWEKIRLFDMGWQCRSREGRRRLEKFGLVRFTSSSSLVSGIKQNWFVIRAVRNWTRLMISYETIIILELMAENWTNESLLPRIRSPEDASPIDMPTIDDVNVRISRGAARETKKVLFVCLPWIIHRPRPTLSGRVNIWMGKMCFDPF